MCTAVGGIFLEFSYRCSLYSLVRLFDHTIAHKAPLLLVRLAFLNLQWKY